MRRGLLPALVLALAALPSLGGPRVAEMERRAAEVAGMLRGRVVRVAGFRQGGLASSGFLVGDGDVVVTWSRRASPGDEVAVFRADCRQPGEVLDRHEATGLTLVGLGHGCPGGGLARGGPVEVGEPVFAAGHPFGTPRGDGGPSVALGIVAQVRPDGTCLISAAVNPGEYGGPLVDRLGRAIGVLLPGGDPTTGLSRAAPLAVLPGLPPPPEDRAAAGGWPVHDRLRAVAANAWPAVLSVGKVEAVEVGEAPPAPEEWFTAVLVDREGHALTTWPDLSPGQSLLAVLPDGREFPAETLGRVERLGVSMIRIDGADLPPPPEVSAEEPAVGAFVVGVGNPNGRAVDRGPLLSVGIVGARNRADRTFGALLTDAPVNGGNAGGPLLDLGGRVIGYLSTLDGAALTDAGANSGIGYAIPAASVLRHLDRLRAGESIPFRPGYLGVTLSLDPVEGGGALVTAVVSGRPAAEAGIQAGDVIVAADEEPIDGYEDVRRVFGSLEEGQEVRVRVRRGGEELTIPVVLGLLPSELRR